jgi:hypothetical protein
MITAQDYYERIQRMPPISSGDPNLDLLLQGGFIQGPVHFLYGPSALLSGILMKTAVNSQLARVDGGGECQQIAYIDGENTFNPYYISKYALSKQANPNYVLDRILVSRTFTWNQMVEVVEEKIARLASVDMVLISGLTSMFEEAVTNPSTPIAPRGKQGNSSQPPAVNWSPFQDLNRMIGGLKRITEKCEPIIVITGPFNSKSRTRPAGGQILTHFGGILVGIEDQERYLDFTLYQHPYLPFRKERGWKSIQSRGNTQAHRLLIRDPQNLTLDTFFKH